jgi:hypothetical protein
MSYYVPGHEANPAGRIRRALLAAIGDGGWWERLPGWAQGMLCGCHICKGRVS